MRGLSLRGLRAGVRTSNMLLQALELQFSVHLQISVARYDFIDLRAHRYFSGFKMLTAGFGKKQNPQDHDQIGA
jgi:hypothetical protein